MEVHVGVYCARGLFLVVGDGVLADVFIGDFVADVNVLVVVDVVVVCCCHDHADARLLFPMRYVSVLVRKGVVVLG